MAGFSTSPSLSSSPEVGQGGAVGGIVTFFYTRPLAQKGDLSVVTELPSGVATLGAVCSMFLTQVLPSLTSCRPVVEQGKSYKLK